MYNLGKPVALASAPSDLIVPIILPFWDSFPYFEAAANRQGTTEAAANAQSDNLLSLVFKNVFTYVLHIKF